MVWSIKNNTSTTVALILGIGVGVGAVILYLASGLVFARWNVADFSTRLTLETIGAFLLLGALTVITFAIPITAYFRFHVLAPVVLLGIVLFGWFSYAAATGILTSEDVFGLGLYAIGLSPLYFICYVILGGTEYYARNRTPS